MIAAIRFGKYRVGLACLWPPVLTSPRVTTRPCPFRHRDYQATSPILPPAFHNGDFGADYILV